MTKPKKLIDDLLAQELANKSLDELEEELRNLVYVTSCLYCNYDGAQTEMNSSYKIVCPRCDSRYCIH